jgi:hypothetical protein
MQPWAAKWAPRHRLHLGSVEPPPYAPVSQLREHHRCDRIVAKKVSVGRSVFLRWLTIGDVHPEYLKQVTQ